MKTSFRITLLAVLLMALILPSCQKYDEGPFLSLASAKSRVVNKWKIEQAYANDSDVTSWLNLAWPDYSIEMKSDDSYVITMTADTSEVGSWTLDNPKENILTTPTGSMMTTTWNILKLKKNEMWVKYTDWGGTRWEMHLVTK